MITGMELQITDLLWGCAGPSPVLTVLEAENEMRVTRAERHQSQARHDR